MVGWEKYGSCLHVMLCALHSLAAVGKVSKPRRSHPLGESLRLSTVVHRLWLLCMHMTHSRVGPEWCARQTLV